MTLHTHNIASINDFLSGDIDLCSPPEIFMRVTQALDSNKNGAADIASIIEQDPSLSSRMLKIVNSAFFGFPATVKTVNQAITILGHKEIRLLVMTTSVVEEFSDMPNALLDMREFWSHSLKTALFSKHLADKHPKKRMLSSSFVSGLLHDIGRLVLYMKSPDLARAAALSAQVDQVSEAESEVNTFGFSHADIGGALLELWKIPDSIQQAALFHHTPTLATNHSIETNIVYLANKLAHADTSSEQSLNETCPPTDPIWDSIEIPYACLATVSSEVMEEFSKTYTLFFGD